MFAPHYLLMLAALALPGLAQAQAVVPPAPALAPPRAASPGVGTASDADLANRLRGAPTGRSGAATRGLPAPRDAQALGTDASVPGAAPPAALAPNAPPITGR